MTIGKILVTGGSGFIGSHLIPLLQADGKSVNILSRRADGGNTFRWDVRKKYIDTTALTNVGTIIHLAGASLAEKRWTASYKKVIIESRVDSAKFLFDTLRSTKHSVHTFISASAVGYYGNTGDVWVEEDFHSTEDFLGTTCTLWEEAAHQFEQLGIRTAIIRTGFVLANDGGALPVMSKPVQYFVGAPLGSGKQYLSWIHVDDLCRIFAFAASNSKLYGVYNAVAPGPVTNKVLIRNIGGVLGRPIWPIPVPSFLLKLILGEKVSLVTGGQRVSSEKIRMAGFRFKHVDLQKTLESLLAK